MSTQKPEWKCVGSIGYVDPIAYGGAFVYTDSCGVYGPEMTWFEPASDEAWHKTEGATKISIYRVLIENQPTGEWWWEDVKLVARCAGLDVEEFEAMAISANPLERAIVYGELIRYYGADHFDSYPVQTTEDEAYARYAEEFKVFVSGHSTPLGQVETT